MFTFVIAVTLVASLYATIRLVRALNGAKEEAAIIRGMLESYDSDMNKAYAVGFEEGRIRTGGGNLNAMLGKKLTPNNIRLDMAAGLKKLNGLLVEMGEPAVTMGQICPGVQFYTNQAVAAQPIRHSQEAQPEPPPIDYEAAYAGR